MRQYHLLVRSGQDCSRLGHEMDTTKNDCLSAGPITNALRQLKGVTHRIGVTDNLVTLVVVTENQKTLAKRLTGSRDPLKHVLGGG